MGVRRLRTSALRWCCAAAVVALVSPAGMLGATPTAAAAVTAPPPAAAAPQPEIPVELVDSAQGGYLPTVQVSINGSTPVTMMIDEGTPFLVTFPGSIVDPEQPVTQTGIAHSIQYDGSSASGQIATATVTVGAVSTPQQVAFLDADSCTPHCLGYQNGIQGVIGIGQAKHADGETDDAGTAADALYPVLAQLGPTLSAGYTIDFTNTTPVVRLGAPDPTAPGNSIIRRAVDDGRTYPNGQSVFLSPVICWLISADRNIGASCHATVLDTGQGTGRISGDVFDSVVTPVDSGTSAQTIGWVKTGAVLALSTSTTAPPFARLISTGEQPHRYAQVPVSSTRLGSLFNAGNDLYLSHEIGFDNDTGDVIIHAASRTPHAPVNVTALAGDGSVGVRWTAPDSAGDTPLTGFIITVSAINGQLVSTTTTAAQVVAGEVGGLANGEPYLIAVAAINGYGVGAGARAPGAVTPHAPGTNAQHVDGAADSSAPATLADSGSALSPLIVVLAAAMVLAGAVLRVRSAGGQRDRRGVGYGA